MAYSGGHVGERGVVSSAGRQIINNILVINLAIIIITTISLVTTTNANYNNIYSDEWVSGAHATFYGQPGDKPDSMGGACGYGAMTKQWYGSATTALSDAMFNRGATCGQCFELRCVDERNWPYCKPGHPTVTVTATNQCPGGGLGWCDSPKHHFDMDLAAWETIGIYNGGIIPVEYKRVSCVREGGVRFTMDKQNEYFYLVLISNVGGAGSVTAMSYSTDNVKWKAMERNWGQNWQITEPLPDQRPLSFRVTTEDGEPRDFNNALPAGWASGRTYQAST